jgi:group I intron endonuclease
VTANQNIGTVYLCFCSLTGLAYVGQTRLSVKDRWRQHVKHAREGRPYALHSAIREHGPEAFWCVALVTTSGRLDLDAWERFFVSFFGTASGSGYNLQPGGRQGPNHAESTKAQLSAAARGNKRCVGRVLSDETRAKIGAANRSPSEETRAKMRAAKVGFVPWNKGRKLSGRRA